MHKADKMHSLDPDSRSDMSVGLQHPDESYDENDELGLPIWPGFGQGAPVDEKGRYIYSQIGRPVVPHSPLLVGGVLRTMDGEIVVLHQFCLYLNYSPT